jgi:hypothetical protein
VVIFAKNNFIERKHEEDYHHNNNDSLHAVRGILS